MRRQQGMEASEISIDLLLFLLDGQPYAIRLDQVDRVTAAVAVTPLPAAPAIVLGVIDLHGDILPVMDIRQRFGLEGRRPALHDALIVARTATRRVVMLVDRVEGTISRATADLAPTSAILPGELYFDAVTRLPDGPVLIHDIDRFLSLDEERVLDAALESRR